MPHRTPITITSGRHPYEVAIHVAAAACGVAVAVTDRVPRAAAEAMPRPVQVLWIALLVAAGVLAVGGAYWRGTVQTGLRVELAGVLLHAAGSTMYAVSLVVVSGWAAVAAGTFLAGLGFGAWWRAGQIVHDIRRLTAARRAAQAPVLVEGG